MPLQSLLIAQPAQRIAAHHLAPYSAGWLSAATVALHIDLCECCGGALRSPSGIPGPARARQGCAAPVEGLLLTERQAAVLSAVRVVFDSDPGVHSGSGPTSTLEQSIRLAASICAAYQQANALVECCFGHESIRVASGRPGLARFLDTLATFQACDHDHHDCQHTHPITGCRRIHHGNCGVFQVTITTRRGLRLRTEHRHVHGDQLWLVVDDDDAAAALPHLAGRVVSVGAATAPLPSFRRAWRHLCHAG